MVLFPLFPFRRILFPIFPSRRVLFLLFPSRMVLFPVLVLSNRHSDIQSSTPTSQASYITHSERLMAPTRSPGPVGLLLRIMSNTILLLGGLALGIFGEPPDTRGGSEALETRGTWTRRAGGELWDAVGSVGATGYCDDL